MLRPEATIADTGLFGGLWRNGVGSGLLHLIGHHVCQEIERKHYRSVPCQSSV